MAEHGHRTGWMKNLKKYPEVCIAFADYQVPVLAQVLDKEQDSRKLQVGAQLFCEKYGWGDGLPEVLEPSAPLVGLD